MTYQEKLISFAPQMLALLEEAEILVRGITGEPIHPRTAVGDWLAEIQEVLYLVRGETP